MMRVLFEALDSYAYYLSSLFSSVIFSLSSLRSPVSRLYAGKMKDTIRCTNCGFERNRFDDFLDVQVRRKKRIMEVFFLHYFFCFRWSYEE